METTNISSHQTNLKSLWRPPLVDFVGGSPGGRWSCWWVTGLRSSRIFSGREKFVSNKWKPLWWDGGLYIHGLVEFQGLKVSPLLDFGFRVLACSSNAFACRSSILCRCSVHKSCQHWRLSCRALNGWKDLWPLYGSHSWLDVWVYVIYLNHPGFPLGWCIHAICDYRYLCFTYFREMYFEQRWFSCFLICIHHSHM